VVSEKKTSLKVPEAFLPLLEDVRLLKSDGQNPNKMTDKLKDELWFSLLEYGWTDPILTDQAGLLCDGEQRVTVCGAHNEFFAPVLRLDMTDAERREARQGFNKLRGKHNKLLDQAEWERLLASTQRENLKRLLDAVGEKLPEYFDDSAREGGSNMIPESYELIIECNDEADQKAKFAHFTSEGLKVRILNL
jgi:hypothetical protein